MTAGLSYFGYLLIGPRRGRRVGLQVGTIWECMRIDCSGKIVGFCLSVFGVVPVIFACEVGGKNGSVRGGLMDFRISNSFQEQNVRSRDR